MGYEAEIWPYGAKGLKLLGLFLFLADDLNEFISVIYVS